MKLKTLLKKNLQTKFCDLYKNLILLILNSFIMKKNYYYQIILFVLYPMFGLSQSNVSIEFLGDYPNNEVYQIVNYNVVNEKLYFFGGHQSGSSPYVCSNKITIYDLSDNTFSVMDFNLPYGIFDYCGASYYNNNFYLSPGFATGNTNGWGTHKKIIEVDINFHQSSEINLINGDNIWNMTNIEVNGKIYFMGGHNGGDQTKIYEYDPLTDELQQVSNMNYPRNNSALIYGTDGWIYIIGDWDETVNIERFSPTSYAVEDLGIPSPVYKPYFYWHIGDNNEIYFLNSYNDNSELIKFNYNLNTIENTGVIISEKLVNRCIIDSDNESVIYGFVQEEIPPYKLCKLTLENYTSINNKHINKDLIVYPNPTSGSINIQSSNSTIDIVKLVNQYGKTVSVFHFSNTMDLSKLNNGIYILLFYDKNENLLGSSKVIKK